MPQKKPESLTIKISEGDKQLLERLCLQFRATPKEIISSALKYFDKHYLGEIEEDDDNK